MSNTNERGTLNHLIDRVRVRNHFISQGTSENKANQESKICNPNDYFEPVVEPLDPLGKFITKDTVEFISSLRDTLYESQFVNDENKPSADIDKMDLKLGELLVENIDIEKSLKRGFRDLIKGNPLKTEMKEKIKQEVLDPFREYVNQESTKTLKPKEEINAQLDAIEEKYMTASKAR